MKSFSVFIISLLIFGNTAMAQVVISKQADNGKALYILNGKVTTKAVINALDAGVIDNIDVYKDLDRVVIVSTERDTNNQRYNFKWNTDSVIKVAYEKNILHIISDTTRTVRGTITHSRTPIYVVRNTDGSTVVVPNLQKISTNMIRTINLIKDEVMIRKILANAKGAENKVAKGGIIYIQLKPSRD